LDTLFFHPNPWSTQTWTAGGWDLKDGLKLVKKLAMKVTSLLVISRYQNSRMAGFSNLSEIHVYGDICAEHVGGRFQSETLLNDVAICHTPVTIPEPGTMECFWHWTVSAFLGLSRIIDGFWAEGIEPSFVLHSMCKRCKELEEES
jgi:hypothetical protein